MRAIKKVLWLLLLFGSRAGRKEQSKEFIVLMKIIYVIEDFISGCCHVDTAWIKRIFVVARHTRFSAMCQASARNHSWSYLNLPNMSRHRKKMNGSVHAKKDCEKFALAHVTCNIIWCFCSTPFPPERFSPNRKLLPASVVFLQLLFALVFLYGRI